MEREEESLWFFLGGFNYSFKAFTRKIGEVSHFDEYFSNGLVQTPTSFSSEPLFFLLDVHITMEKTSTIRKKNLQGRITYPLFF